MTSAVFRYAVYAAPVPESPLGRFAAAWLGRDAVHDRPVLQPTVAGLSSARLAALTAEPRLYGFHATLKPPFRLAEGRTLEALEAALTAFAQEQGVVPLPSLVLRRIGRFLVLEPDTRSDAIQALAADCVTRFDTFRAPAAPEEIAHRRAAGLTPAQDANLLRWGYPYVLDEFRFHYTLTGRLEQPEEAALIEQYLTDAAAPLAAEPAHINALCLFVQPQAGAPFRILRRYPLTG